VLQCVRRACKRRVAIVIRRCSMGVTMNLRRAFLVVLLIYSSGAAAYNETLSFMRTSEGDTIATISGFRPLCGIVVHAPLDVSVAGSSIDITSNTLAGGGGCVPPPDYAGPPYAVSVSLGHLAPMVYTVRWLWEDWPTPIMTGTLDPSKLSLPVATAVPVPLISAGGLTCLAWLVVFTGMVSLRTSRAHGRKSRST
jgi:hypothetical protein